MDRSRDRSGTGPGTGNVAHFPSPCGPVNYRSAKFTGPQFTGPAVDRYYRSAIYGSAIYGSRNLRVPIVDR